MGLLDWLFGNKRANEPRPSARGGPGRQVGERVLARWFDSYFYPARIDALDGERCEVTYDDGDRAWVHQANVHRPDLDVGTKVHCRGSSGPNFRPAQVRKQLGEKLQVRYDDGQEEWTTLSMVRVVRPIVDVGEDPQPVGDMPMPIPAGMQAPGMPVGMMPPGGQPQILDAGEPIQDSNWRTGDRVLARWWDLFWYPGSILAIGTKGFHILYDDGDQRLVPEINLMPLAVEEGEQIFIRPKNQPQRVYLPATITRVRNETIDVEYEDGNTETNTRLGRARLWRCPVGRGAFPFDEGDRVLGADMDGFVYPAEIVSVEDDKVVVQFLDGPERMLTPELIRVFDVKSGHRVECRWKGGPQYFPGMITQMEGDRIHIDYDDGDKEWTTVRLIRLPPKG